MTAIGDMVDFLKANPFISMEQYIRAMNPAMIRIMTADNTHVRYLSEKEAQQRKAKVLDGKNLMNDLGIPIIG